MASQLRIGTSGWNYPHWKGRFYPKDLPEDDWFEHYCREFNTVEINNTFYQQPERNTLDAWRKQAPRGFIYSVKAHRYLTHMRKLKDLRKPLDRFLAGTRRLEDRLGPILYQLPPNWGRNLDRLQEFAELLPKNLTHVIEFRDRQWLTDDTYDLLRNYNLCLCVHDMLPRHPRRVTGSVVYVRFHGAGKKYRGKYRKSRLQHWAEWIATVAQDRRTFVYFNNDDQGYAVDNAKTLRKLIEAEN